MSSFARLSDLGELFAIQGWDLQFVFWRTLARSWRALFSRSICARPGVASGLPVAGRRCAGDRRSRFARRPGWESVRGMLNT